MELWMILERLEHFLSVHNRIDNLQKPESEQEKIYVIHAAEKNKWYLGIPRQCICQNCI